MPLKVSVGLLRKALDQFLAAPGLPEADRVKIERVLSHTYSSDRKRAGGASLWQDPEGYISDSWLVFRQIDQKLAKGKYPASFPLTQFHAWEQRLMQLTKMYRAEAALMRRPFMVTDERKYLGEAPTREEHIAYSARSRKALNTQYARRAAPNPQRGCVCPKCHASFRTVSGKNWHVARCEAVSAKSKVKAAPKTKKLGTYGGYTAAEVKDTLEQYAVRGASAKATGPALVPASATQAVPDTRWKALTQKVFSGPVYLEFGVLAPHGTSAAAKRAGWKEGAKRWVTKRVKFDGNVARLHSEIRKSMTESGDFHHMAFEMLTRKGAHEGLPVWEVFLAS